MVLLLGANDKSTASLTPFRALGKQSIRYGGRRIDSCWKSRRRHTFRESLTPRFAEMGCGESRPNPAGNETGAHQAVDGADDGRRRPVERAAAGGLQGGRRSPPDAVPPLPAR